MPLLLYGKMVCARESAPALFFVKTFRVRPSFALTHKHVVDDEPDSRPCFVAN